MTTTKKVNEIKTETKRFYVIAYNTKNPSTRKDITLYWNGEHSLVQDIEFAVRFSRFKEVRKEVKKAPQPATGFKLFPIVYVVYMTIHSSKVFVPKLKEVPPCCQQFVPPPIKKKKLMTKTLLQKFQNGDYECRIYRIEFDEFPEHLRNDLFKFLNVSWLCGYVSIPKNHPFTDKDFSSSSINDLSVHGGITFRDKLEDSDLVFIGFDCNHYDDLTNPKDEHYVKKECDRLVEQLREIDIDIKYQRSRNKV